MESDWLTYEQAAERLETTAEGVRQRAIRKRWPRQIGNDGLARVRPPDGWPDPGRTLAEQANRRPVRTPAEHRPNAHLVSALQAHVETLKEQLAAAEARASSLAAEIAAHDAKHTAELEAERAHTEAERAKTAKAIEAFSALADRLDALAAANQRQSFLKRLKQRLVG